MASWRHWWTAPVLIFSAITGPAGYRILIAEDPAAVTVIPPALYFTLLTVTLTSLAVLTMTIVIAVLWSVDYVIDVFAEKNRQINADIAYLRSLPVDEEVDA